MNRSTDVANLPRGVLIGTVELFDCDGGNWHVRNPERAEKLIPPTKQPQPAWFHPFDREWGWVVLFQFGDR